jgi:hypothetical protein
VATRSLAAVSPDHEDSSMSIDFYGTFILLLVPLTGILAAI